MPAHVGSLRILTVTFQSHTKMIDKITVPEIVNYYLKYYDHAQSPVAFRNGTAVVRSSA